MFVISVKGIKFIKMHFSYLKILFICRCFNMAGMEKWWMLNGNINIKRRYKKFVDKICASHLMSILCRTYFLSCQNSLDVKNYSSIFNEFNFIVEVFNWKLKNRTNIQLISVENIFNKWICDKTMNCIYRKVLLYMKNGLFLKADVAHNYR